MPDHIPELPKEDWDGKIRKAIEDFIAGRITRREMASTISRAEQDERNWQRNQDERAMTQAEWNELYRDYGDGWGRSSWERR